jgi:hypothetical protein
MATFMTSPNGSALIPVALLLFKVSAESMERVRLIVSMKVKEK